MVMDWARKTSTTIIPLLYDYATSWKGSIVFPILCTFHSLLLFWVLLFVWAADGFPRYTQDDSAILYVSDVCAVHKPLAIGLGTVPAVLYVVTLVVDFILRRKNLLLSSTSSPSRRLLQHMFSIVSIGFGFLASTGLILLTIFDNIHHQGEHGVFAVMFFISFTISGILTSIEKAIISFDHPKIIWLRRLYKIKSVLILSSGAVLTAFAAVGSSCDEPSGHVTSKCNGTFNAAALCEWSASLLFCGYMITLIVDQLKSSRASTRGGLGTSDSQIGLTLTQV